jgi:gliding motility-associated-like protein
MLRCTVFLNKFDIHSTAFIHMRRFLLIVFSLFLFSGMANSQAGLCPSNLDFEQGDFTGWVCQAGSVDLAGVITLAPTAPIPGRHTIISAATAGTDPYGRFPEICPNGSGYSVRLGNSGGNHQAEGISYTYTIPSNLTVFSMLFNYAIVLQDPSHQVFEQPRFQARIRDLTTNNPIPCVDFDFAASSSLPGFLPSPLGGGVFYKNWTPITINLTPYIGRTIQLEFTTNDCVYSAHFGYAYVDVNTSCNGAITGNYICPGNAGITLNAPFGFQNYTWYSDNTFSTILSTSQTLSLTPAPAAGTIFPIVVEPYPGFGCRDTLYANVQIAGNPVANAGPDASTCTNVPLQLGIAPQTGISYAWTPATYLSNTTVSNPFASPPGGGPTEYILTATDILTGCFSKDTTYITGLQADTAIGLVGKNSYCVGETAPGILSVSNLLLGVQWYDGNTPIPGATGFSYQPTATGNYWAQVRQLGCTDSTRVMPFVIHPLPVADAGSDANLCINETLQIGTTATPSYTYAWTPAAQVSNASSSNPLVWAIGTAPQEFIVHTINSITGCEAFDTTVITGLVMDTLITLTGKNDFCDGDAGAGTLQVNNTLQAVQWYDGNTAIPGATGFSYHPMVTGNYWAQLQQAGCTDSTKTIRFDIHPIPVADFRLSNDSACITSHSFTYTNQSTASDGAAMTYVWKLGDNTTQTTLDAIKTYINPGAYTIRLTATTSFGCVDDAADSTVYVMPNAKPYFTWDSICVNRPVQFFNQTSENGSPKVDYSWQFNNAGPGYLIKNPPPITYNSSGIINVTLKSTTLGCENFPDSVTRKVQVNKPKEGIRYKTITVPQGASMYIHVRDSVGKNYWWKPSTQLSRYTTQYTEFFATGNDVDYTIEITDIHTCVTTDSLLMQILKKPGYYLPTAFTPNGDGLNDDVRPYLVGMKSLKSFSVFNRWGNLVFFSKKEGEAWNGKSNGVNQDNGVYVWILEFYDSNNKLVTEKGTITIIR